MRNPNRPQATGILLETYEHDKDLIRLHNDLSKEHVGNQICWTMKGKIKTMQYIAKVYNDKDTSAGTKPFYNSMATWCVETLTSLDATLNNINMKAHPTRTGEIDFNKYFVELITVLGLKCPKKLDDASARVALNMTKPIAAALSVDTGKLVNQVYPEVKIKVDILNQYLKMIYAKHAEYSRLSRLTYPDPAQDEKDAYLEELAQQEPETVEGWDVQDHSVEV